jgi:hypothetical protein
MQTTKVSLSRELEHQKARAIANNKQLEEKLLDMDLYLSMLSIFANATPYMQSRFPTLFLTQLVQNGQTNIQTNYNIRKANAQSE